MMTVLSHSQEWPAEKDFNWSSLLDLFLGRCLILQGIYMLVLMFSTEMN